MTSSRFFFFNVTATTEIYTLSLHDALPIWSFQGNQRAVDAKLRRRARGDVEVGRPLHITTGSPDRKSTRLNSSHQIISYAVFCLKKKKNRHNKHIIHETNDAVLDPTLI